MMYDVWWMMYDECMMSFFNVLNCNFHIKKHRKGQIRKEKYTTRKKIWQNLFESAISGDNVGYVVTLVLSAVLCY